MNCAEIHLLLHAYADGELDVVRSLDVEQHLKTCADVRGQIKFSEITALRVEGQRSRLSRAGFLARRRCDKWLQRQPLRDEIRPFDLQWLWKWLAVGATAVAILAITLRPLGTFPNDQHG